MPLVSIITPAYNTESLIIETIKSIQAQTVTDWELLIIDDCSTDGTKKIAEEYSHKDARIKVLSTEKNSGIAIARNVGIEAAEGRYIALCDSDDMWAENKLEKQISFMREHDCALSYSSFYRCTEDGQPYRTVSCRRKTTYRDICKCNCVPCLTGMYDTAMTGKILTPVIWKRQDWALWIKVLEKCGTGYGIDDPLAYYRVRSGSLSKGRRSNIEYDIKILTDVLGYSRLRAVLHYWLVTMPRKI